MGLAHPHRSAEILATRCPVGHNTPGDLCLLNTKGKKSAFPFCYSTTIPFSHRLENGPSHKMTTLKLTNRCKNPPFLA